MCLEKKKTVKICAITEITIVKKIIVGHYRVICYFKFFTKKKRRIKGKCYITGKVQNCSSYHTLEIRYTKNSTVSYLKRDNSYDQFAETVNFEMRHAFHNMVDQILYI
jgi:hypothetical protein